MTDPGGRPQTVVKDINVLAKEFGVTPQTIRNRLKKTKYGQWRWDDKGHSRVQLNADYADYFYKKKWENKKVITKEPRSNEKDYENYFYLPKYNSPEKAQQAAERQVQQEIEKGAGWTVSLSGEDLEREKDKRIKLYTLRNLDEEKKVKRQGAQEGEIGQINFSLPHFVNASQNLKATDQDYFIDQCMRYMRLLHDPKSKQPPNVYQRTMVLNQVIDEIIQYRKQLLVYAQREKDTSDLQKELDSISRRIDGRASSLGLARRRGDVILGDEDEDDDSVITPGLQSEQSSFGEVQ